MLICLLRTKTGDMTHEYLWFYSDWFRWMYWELRRCMRFITPAHIPAETQIFFVVYLLSCCFFFCFFCLMQWGGVCEIVSKFQWLWPPPLLTCKAHTPNSPHPTCTPPPPRRSRLEDITLYFRCRSPEAPRWGPSSPRPWRPSPLARFWRGRSSQPSRYGGESKRGERGERRFR